MDSKTLYEKIYNDNSWYGNAKEHRCPGVRLIPKYKDFLYGRIFDVGAGRGHTVDALRELGYTANGIDIVDFKNGLSVGDITLPFVEDTFKTYQTAICLDVIEHIHIKDISGLFWNLAHFEHQVICIQNDSHGVDGIELHITRMVWPEWDTLIEYIFNVTSVIIINPNQKIYITKQNKDLISLDSLMFAKKVDDFFTSRKIL